MLRGERELQRQKREWKPKLLLLLLLLLLLTLMLQQSVVTTKRMLSGRAMGTQSREVEECEVASRVHRETATRRVR